MYIPNKFRQDNIEEMISLMRSHPFATLVTSSNSGIEANHLPVLVNEADGDLYVKAHIAKANPLWRSVEEGADVLTIFHGPHCYVSPNYYPTKAETGKAVPTWNYAVIHVRGKLSFIHQPSWILQTVTELTDVNEANQSPAWSVSDAPSDYIDKMLAAIVGIEIKVEFIEGKWKLSQNQPNQNHKGVVDGLLSEPSALASDVAHMMNAATTKQK